MYSNEDIVKIDEVYAPAYVIIAFKYSKTPLASANRYYYDY